MTPKTIPVTPEAFKNPLAPSAAIFYTLSALLGLAGIWLLVDPEYAALLIRDRIAGGVVLRSSLNIWYLIDTTITVLSFLCPAVMAAGLWIVLRGRFAPGMKWITSLLQGLLWAVYGSACLILVIYIAAMLKNIVVYLRYNTGVYLVYSLLITEGLMAVQAWLVYLLIRKFLRESSDCACSITYTLTSGKLDSMPIPSFPRLGLLILGCMQLVLAWDSVFTLTIAENYVGDTYIILVAEHPGQYLAAATLITGALGNVLLSLYLRQYNRICERTRFQFNRLA